MKTLILGCGNPDRADDAAGLLVARRLRELGVDAREHHGDILSLIDEWSGYEEVIIIDAMVSGAPAGTVVVFDGNEEVPSQQFHASTHEFGLVEAIELARLLDRLPQALTIYGLEAGNCSVGGDVSPDVAHAVERVASEILEARAG